jgi:hypothetical protein
VNFLVSLLVITILIAMVYRVLPDVRLAWPDVWIGAVTTWVLFGVGKLRIGLYLGHASGSSYGAPVHWSSSWCGCTTRPSSCSLAPRSPLSTLSTDDGGSRPPSMPLELPDKLAELPIVEHCKAVSGDWAPDRPQRYTPEQTVALGGAKQDGPDEALIASECVSLQSIERVIARGFER